jgi:hypothetical protein
MLMSSVPRLVLGAHDRCACVHAGAQEPAAAALLGLRVLREVLPPQRAEANVREALLCSSYGIISCNQVFHFSVRNICA